MNLAFLLGAAFGGEALLFGSFLRGLALGLGTAPGLGGGLRLGYQCGRFTVERGYLRPFLGDERL